MRRRWATPGADLSGLLSRREAQAELKKFVTARNEAAALKFSSQVQQP